MIREAIATVVGGRGLSRAEAEAVMGEIMGGEATPAQIGAFLTALRLKGETVDEITGFAATMRAKATRVRSRHASLVDTCGTGGDGLRTFNISTAAAFIAAGAGAIVAKHGNRSVSSACGSADVLRALGVNIEAPLDVVERCLDEIGIAFLFAPMLHAAMKHAIGPRREIGIRSVFNILGPLTNPAGVKAQLLGVYDGALVERLANVLRNLGSERVFVVHGEDGQDEISITGPTTVAELADGKVRSCTIRPEDFGLTRASLDDVLGGDAKANATMLRETLAGRPGPRRDAAALNAAAVIAAAGRAASIAEAMPLAREAIDSGRAMEKLDRLVELTSA